MPRWKPKTPLEKFQAELRRLETRISTKRAELAELESNKKQLEMVVHALGQSDSGRPRAGTRAESRG